MSIKSITSVDGACSVQKSNEEQLVIDKTNNEQAIKTEFYWSVALVMARQYLKMAIAEMNEMINVPRRGEAFKVLIDAIANARGLLFKCSVWEEISKKAMGIAFTAFPKFPVKETEKAKEGILETKRLCVEIQKRRIKILSKIEYWKYCLYFDPLFATDISDIARLWMRSEHPKPHCSYESNTAINSVISEKEKRWKNRHPVLNKT